MMAMYTQSVVRKTLFDMFNQLTQNDVWAANFFIRSESSKTCKDFYELMDVLEKLAYFHVSKNKVKLGRLIELFGNINRDDLQTTLQTYADGLCCNDYSSSVSSIGEEHTSKSSEDSESSAEETNLGGNDSSSSVFLNGEKHTSKSSDDPESSDEETNLGGEDVEEGPRASNSAENTIENSKPQIQANAKVDELELDFTKISLDPQVIAETTIAEQFDSSTDETNLGGEDVEEGPSASNSAENTIENSKPQIQANATVDELELDFTKISLDPQVIAETTINEQFDSSSDEESNSFETSVNSEASLSSELVTLYNYQNELAEKGKTGVNSIICSPTGSGKTITAASVIKHNLEAAKQRDRPYRVLYLVHIRYLVKHLAIDLKKILGDEVYPLEDNDLLTNEIVQSKAVVILTAQILDNALNSKIVSLSEYDLLVFDECHNAVRKHPYNEIMKKYHEMKRGRKRLPEVLGLSATLGGGQDPFGAIVKLCANMYTTWVSSVRDRNNLKELLKKNKAPMIDEIITCKTRLPDEFFKNISTAIKTYIIQLESDHNISFGFIQEGSQEMEIRLTQQRNDCEELKQRAEVKIINFLIYMNKALIYYNELTAYDAFKYLQDKFKEPDSTDQEIEKEIANVYEMTLKNIKEFAANDKLEKNEKLLKLKELLCEILEPNPEKKVILLCQTRFNALHLKDLIMDDIKLKKFVKADFIIGQGDDGLTQNQQIDILKRFGNNQLNLLIATSIAEQGLNIPDCEIVIRYLYVKSSISRRQAHGRARKENSMCYLIAEENNEHVNREYRNRLQEKEMDVALNKVTEMGERTFKEKVLEEIKVLHRQADIEKMIGHSFDYCGDDIVILCKECHNILCCGSEIIKKGTNYICINPDFESKVDVIAWPEKVYRYDSSIGMSVCNGEQCKNSFGAVMKYKYGDRRRGFTLNIKKILFKFQENIPFHLKKWAKHPFPIQEESLS